MTAPGRNRRAAPRPARASPSPLQIARVGDVPTGPENPPPWQLGWSPPVNPPAGPGESGHVRESGQFGPLSTPMKQNRYYRSIRTREEPARNRRKGCRDGEVSVPVACRRVRRSRSRRVRTWPPDPLPPGQRRPAALRRNSVLQADDHLSFYRVVVGNWRREAARFVPDLELLVVHGSDRRERLGESPTIISSSRPTRC